MRTNLHLFVTTMIGALIGLHSANIPAQAADNSRNTASQVKSSSAADQQQEITLSSGATNITVSTQQSASSAAGVIAPRSHHARTRSNSSEDPTPQLATSLRGGSNDNQPTTTRHRSAGSTGTNANAYTSNLTSVNISVTNPVSVADPLFHADGTGAALATGLRSVAAGDTAYAGQAGAVAVGANATATAANSVALGAGSTAARGSRPSFTDPISGIAKASAGEVSVGSAGAERQITNVAAGSVSTDAVNLAQLQSAFGQANDLTDLRFNKAMRANWATAAGAAAIAMLPQSPAPGRALIGLAGGTSHGEAAFAVGASYLSEDERFILKGGASLNSQGNSSIGASIGYVFP